MDDYPECPECNGKSRKNGFFITRKGRVQRWQCVECGRQFRDPKAEGG